MANALKLCGSLTIWFDPGMAWAALPTGKRGRQPVCTDAAVQTCLTMKGEGRPEISPVD
jgi:Transposase DDE domain